MPRFPHKMGLTKPTMIPIIPLFQANYFRKEKHGDQNPKVTWTMKSCLVNKDPYVAYYNPYINGVVTKVSISSPIPPNQGELITAHP